MGRSMNVLFRSVKCYMMKKKKKITFCGLRDSIRTNRLEASKRQIGLYKRKILPRISRA